VPKLILLGRDLSLERTSAPGNPSAVIHRFSREWEWKKRERKRKRE
jgi:hypothetical protein